MLSRVDKGLVFYEGTRMILFLQPLPPCSQESGSAMRTLIFSMIMEGEQGGKIAREAFDFPCLMLF